MTCWFYAPTDTGRWILYQRASDKFDKTRKDMIVEDAGIYQGIVIKKEEQTYKGGKREGTFTSWNNLGDVVMTGLYVADKKDGTWTLFRYGERESEETFVNGKKNGPAVFYHRQSPRPDHKVSEGTYKNDNKVGVWKAYNTRNGQVREETTYDENGTKRAIRGFWDDGKPRMERTFNTRGVEDGVHRQWDSGGELTFERIYENGKPLPRKKVK